MIALLEAYRAGLFRKSEIWRNIVAGLATSLLGGIRVLLCGIHPRLHRALERAEILSLVGPGNICADMAEMSRRIMAP
ncbi:MAG: hypothetical protein M3O07_05905 [Pseudomonadota bacterium]|nr:hypothetical protein [Pseudomonadota bacterium]